MARSFRLSISIAIIALFTLAPLSGLAAGQTEQGSARISKRNIPPEFAQAFGFLDYIKFPSEPESAFNARNAPKWNTETFMSFISKDGVLFTDVNDSSKSKWSFDRIKSAIQSRKGNIFVVFAHLSHIYSNPYKQYSELAFQKTKNGQVITLSYGYKLTFAFEGSRYRLIQCDFTAEEGC